MTAKKFWLIGSIVISFFSTITQAQIVPDGTTIDTIIEGDCLTQCNITGGIKAEDNLFHSFQLFNVELGAKVLFADPGVSNIFSRVTGGEISQILGTLGVFGGDANLFLLNPNGIIFGSQARLDVNGSFVATTADAIKFGDRGFFSASSADGDNIPLLTVKPSALFLNQISASGLGNQITVENGANLAVPASESLVLLGAQDGIVLNGAKLQAPQGRVELGAVSQPGTIGLTDNFQLDFPPDIGRANISLTQGAIIDVTGSGGGNVRLQGAEISLNQASGIISNTLSNLDGGKIAIAAEKLRLEDNSFLSAFTFGEGKGGSINIEARESVELIGTGTEHFQQELIAKGLTGNLTHESTLTGFLTGTTGTGTAGNISIASKNLTLSRGAVLFSPTFGSGTGGNIAARVAENTTVNGSGIIASTQLNGKGKTGNLTLDTHNLTVRDGAVVSTSTLGEGKGGNINIQATETVELGKTPARWLIPNGIFTNTIFGTGKAGDLTINTQQLIMREGAAISSASGAITSQGLIPLGGQGGNITINAADSIEIKGASADGVFPSRIISDTRSNFAGGNLTINTGILTVSDRASISSAAFGAGDGGNLTIDASQKIELLGEGFEPFQQALAGIFVGDISLSDLSSGLITGSLGSGNSGNLTIHTPQLILQDGAAIVTSTFARGTAGDLIIKASDLVEIAGSGLTSTTFSNGNAGNVTIDTSRLVIRDGAVLSTSTLGVGEAGYFQITASESVELLRTPVGALIPNGLYSSTINGTSKAGDIKIATSRFTIKEGAVISAQSGGFFGQQIIPLGGKGGNISIKAAEFIELTGSSPDGSVSSSLNSNTLSFASAGDINLETNTLTVQDGATIAVNAINSGSAGNLNVTADSVNIENKSSLNANTASGKGGNISLDLDSLLVLSDRAEIKTDSRGIGNGGNVNVEADFLIIADRSEITAKAFEGQGGNIQIRTQQLFLSPDSLINASSQLGVDGEVTIKTLDINPGNALVELPNAPLSAEESVVAHCGSRNKTASGEFIITGRGGLPPNLLESAMEETIFVDLGTIENYQLSSEEQTSLIIPEVVPARLTSVVEAQGWYVKSNGNVVLTAETINIENDTGSLGTSVCSHIDRLNY